jgi:hypothetical protein
MPGRMTRALGFSWVLAALLATSSVVAEAPTDSGRLLVDALLRADQGDLRRAGRLASSRGLRPALLSADRLTALAAARAAPAADDAWLLLDTLAEVAAGPDRTLAVAAANAAARIAGELDAAVLLEQDAPRDAVVGRIRAWRSISERADRWADVRVLAMQTAAALSHAGSHALGASVPPEPGYDLAAAARDADAEIRRAAVELLPSPLSTAELAVAAAVIANDPSTMVAISAAQAACAGLALGDPVRRVLAALGPAGLARVRDLVVDPALPAVARIDAARCVAADRSPQSAAAVRKMVGTIPGRQRAPLSSGSRSQGSRARGSR